MMNNDDGENEVDFIFLMVYGNFKLVFYIDTLTNN